MLKKGTKKFKGNLKTNLGKRKGQEEMIGFAFIIIIVAVILIILVGLAFSSKKEVTVVESYKVENFLLSLTSHTTDCTKNSYFKTVGELITEGINQCDDGRITYEVLESTISEIINESWINVGSFQGYVFNVTYNENEIFSMREGNFSLNNQGSNVDLTKGYDLSFVVYS